ncbi:Granule-bound starch synthase 1 [Nymphaea thermarum]|nr:Granule-bound starch synthase 1 [Nymphaea thermarum]
MVEAVNRQNPTLLSMVKAVVFPNGLKTHSLPTSSEAEACISLKLVKGKASEDIVLTYSTAATMTGRSARTIYVGNLPGDIREWEIEDLFYKVLSYQLHYGPIVDIELKNPPRPLGYCFSARDAEDAIRGRDGYSFDGYHLRVELAHGGKGMPSSSDRHSGHGGGSSSRYGPSKRSVCCTRIAFVSIVARFEGSYEKGWGSLFCPSFRDGAMGQVDYTNYEDMKHAVSTNFPSYAHNYDAILYHCSSLILYVLASVFIQIRKLDDTKFRNPFARSYIRVAFCIHNMAYQGRFAFADFRLLNLPDHFKSSFDFMDGYKKPVVGRKINWLKAGILESDIVLTVSPYYALEIISGVAKGVELDHILRTVKLLGIVNGMDAIEWNPRMDKYIDLNYDDTTVSLHLQSYRSSDITAKLGTGKKHMEKQLEELEVLYPDKARGVAKFNVPLAHKIMAGADFILIPSRFEPCGFVQLQAMPYGTPCLVTTTGGLADTVKDGFAGFQMGDFSVECDAVDPADVKAVVATVKRALSVYGTPAHKEMIKNCMGQDFSWKGPPKVWEDTLLGLQVAGSEPGFEGEEIEPLAKHNVATP